MLKELNEANNYITGKIKGNNNNLHEIEQYAYENKVPIVTKEVAEYLKFMADFNKSKNILEIGTAIGYSGSILAQVAQKYNGYLTTIEIDETMYKIAAENFAKLKIDNVTQILGDAGEEISKLDENYDFIFIDAAKGQYKVFFDDSYKLLSKGGLIFIDNILFRGYVYKDECPKRYKTLVKKLDQFIDYLYGNYDFTLIPFGDGIGLVKK